MSESLGPRERIRSKNDFALIYKKGKRFRGKHFTVVFLPNALDYSRMAVVASKRIGNAVERNRVKRRMRALFRRNKEKFAVPHDLVVISKTGIAGADWPELQSEYLSAVKWALRKSQAS